MIEGIARTGEVFGVNALDVFLTWGYEDVRKDPRDRPPRARLARYVDEIDYLMHLVGPDHIGLGPDFTEREGPSGFTIDPRSSLLFPIEMSYAQQGAASYVQGFEKISQVGNVRAELQKRGYSSEHIEKILGGNWMRVYAAAWNA